MQVSSDTIAFLLAAALVGGYLWNRGRWGKLSDEQLAALASGPESRRWKPALQELQRRGHDVQAHVAHIASQLLAPAAEARQAAHAALTDLYPEWERQLTACGYRPEDELSISQQRLQPVLQNLSTLTARSTLPHAEP